jgi:hypothetical protein
LGGDELRWNHLTYLVFTVKLSLPLVVAICGILAIDFPVMAVPQMARHKQSSQVKTNPSSSNQAPSSHSRPIPSNRVRSLLPKQSLTKQLSPTNRQVNVKLVNQTGAPINYEVIGETNQRLLLGQSNVVLQELNTPRTLTFRRQDGGLLMVSPRMSKTPAMLVVTFTATTDLGMDKTAMTIQNNGNVFLN